MFNIINNYFNNDKNYSYDYNLDKYKLFINYNNSEYFKNCEPYFRSTRLSITHMMYISFMHKYTKEKSSKKWMAAYKIQQWWKKLKNNKSVI